MIALLFPIIRLGEVDLEGIYLIAVLYIIYNLDIIRSCLDAYFGSIKGLYVVLDRPIISFVTDIRGSVCMIDIYAPGIVGRCVYVMIKIYPKKEEAGA